MDERILKDLKAAFGIKILAFEPVSGGYLNKKWRVRTDAGELLVKQYSHERFSRRKLDETEAALARQMVLYEAGVLCPRIWKAGERIIRRLSEEIDYMAMDFLPGMSAGPDAVHLPQMKSLGEACAQMHEAFRRIPAAGVKGWPADRKKLLDALREHVSRCAADCPEDASGEYKAAVCAANAWAERTDFSFLDRMETSIAHEDFTPDNMLFSESGLSAILDFDRNRYSFPLHDVGRCLISLAYHDGKMDKERVDAFRSGYAGLTAEAVQDALKLTACIEIPWWIHFEGFGEQGAKVRRFVKEMLFLIGNIS